MEQQQQHILEEDKQIIEDWFNSKGFQFTSQPIIPPPWWARPRPARAYYYRGTVNDSIELLDHLMKRNV